jgi:hypothetical protein
LKVLRLWELLPILLDYLYWLQFFFRSAFFFGEVSPPDWTIYIYYTYIYIILLFIVVGHPQQCLAKQNFSERWVNRNPGHQGSPGVNEDLGGRLPPKKPRKLRQACEEVRKIQSETPGLRERSWEVNRPVEQAGALVPRGAFLTGSEKPRAGGKRIIHRFLLA